MRLRNFSVAAILLSVIPLAFPVSEAQAQTATDTFQVSVTILDSCTIVVNDLDFGSQTTLGSAIDVDSVVTVNCSVTTAYSVSLDQGINGTRLMSDGSDTADYDLYTTALRNVAWGNNVGVDTVGGVGDGNNQVLTVYGRMPVQSTPPPSVYADTVTATIAF